MEVTLCLIILVRASEFHNMVNPCMRTLKNPFQNHVQCKTEHWKTHSPSQHVHGFGLRQVQVEKQGRVNSTV